MPSERHKCRSSTLDRGDEQAEAPAASTTSSKPPLRMLQLVKRRQNHAADPRATPTPDARHNTPARTPSKQDLTAAPATPSRLHLKPPKPPQPVDTSDRIAGALEVYDAPAEALEEALSAHRSSSSTLMPPPPKPLDKSSSPFYRVGAASGTRGANRNSPQQLLVSTAQATLASVPRTPNPLRQTSTPPDGSGGTPQRYNDDRPSDRPVPFPFGTKERIIYRGSQEERSIIRDPVARQQPQITPSGSQISTQNASSDDLQIAIASDHYLESLDLASTRNHRSAASPPPSDRMNSGASRITLSPDEEPPLTFKYQLIIEGILEKPKKTFYQDTNRKEYPDKLGRLDYQNKLQEIEIAALKYAGQRALNLLEPLVLLCVYHSKSPQARQFVQTIDTYNQFYQKMTMAVEKLIEFYTDGYKDLTIKILQEWPSESKNSASASSKASRSNAPAPVSSQRSIQTPTNQQLTARDDAIQDDEQRDLKAKLGIKYRCIPEGACPEKSRHCWIDPSSKDHLPLGGTLLKVWANKIVEDTSGRLSINNLPDSLRTEARKEHHKTKKAKQMKDKNLASPPPFGGQNLHRQLPENRVFAGDLSSLLDHLLEAELAKRHQNKKQLGLVYNRSPAVEEPRRSISRYSSRSTVAPNLESNPVEGDIDEYIPWLQRRYPKLSNELDHAMERLLEKGCSTDQIQRWKGPTFAQHWEDINIKPGLGDRLATWVSKWSIERRQSTPTITRSPRATERVLNSIGGDGGGQRQAENDYDPEETQDESLLRMLDEQDNDDDIWDTEL